MKLPFDLSALHWLREAVDILLVATLFYYLFLLVRGTRAAQMFLGLALLLLISALADFFHLTALEWLMASLRTVWVIGFLILFQPELRRGLSQLGANRRFRGLLRLREGAHLSEIEAAVGRLARRGVGAIIILERSTNLQPFAESGTLLEAHLSAELLETIFTPPSPLHDGAVIVRGNQIVAAGCILPLSQNPMLDRSLGTRHRAILGISEETDAMALAVSEETRQISVAAGGRLVRNVDPNELKAMLAQAAPADEPADDEDDDAADRRAAAVPPYGNIDTGV